MVFTDSRFLFSTHSSQACAQHDEETKFNNKYLKGADVDKIPLFMTKLTQYYSGIKQPHFDNSKNMIVQSKIQKYNTKKLETNAMGKNLLQAQLQNNINPEQIQVKASTIYLWHGFLQLCLCCLAPLRCFHFLFASPPPIYSHEHHALSFGSHP